MHENSLSNRLSPTLKAPQAHPHEPSPRNVEIFSRVRQQGERQEEVAQELGLSQGRVAQICKQVEDWRQWAGERQASGAAADQQTRVDRQLVRRRTQLLFALAVRGLAAHPHDRQWLKLAVQVSGALVEQEQGLAPHQRFAASALGRQLELLLLNVVAQLFPTAQKSAGTASPPAGSASREVPNIANFMHAAAAAAGEEAGGRPTRASAVAEGTCGESTNSSGTVMHATAPK